MDSVRNNTTDCDLMVVLCDEPGESDFEEEDFCVIPIKNLAIPEFQQFVFRYSIMELNTAVKPYAFDYFLCQREYDKVIFFDPDIVVYSSLDPMLALLDEHNVILTPHLTEPIEDGYRPNQADILRSGVYNLGYMGARKGAETVRLVRWWGKHTAKHCIVDHNAGVFVDQKWMDLAPGLFDGVFVNRDRGWNVAYWNLAHRKMEFRGNQYYVNDKLLVFFHFSGYQPLKRIFSIHQNRFSYDNLPKITIALLESYTDRLVENGLHVAVDSKYTYDQFEDGEKIPDILRRVYHDHVNLGKFTLAPDTPNFKHHFYDYLNQPAIIDAKRHGVISVIANEIYDRRIDLREEFPDLYGPDGIKFANWFITSAGRSFSLPEALISPLARNLRQAGMGRTSILDPPARLIVKVYNQSSRIRQIVIAYIPIYIRRKVKRWVFRGSQE